LLPGKVIAPERVSGIRVKIASPKDTKLTYLPFLGKPEFLTGVREGNNLEFVLPALERGAIVWTGQGH